MRITIPDAVADAYLDLAAQQGRSIDVVISDQLKRFRALPPGQRAVVVGGGLLDALDTLFGGQVQDGADLVRRVQDLAGISFHHIRLDFTPSQLAEIQHRVERSGRPAEVQIAEMIRAITDQFFWATAGGPAADPAPAPDARATDELAGV